MIKLCHVRMYNPVGACNHSRCPTYVTKLELHYSVDMTGPDQRVPDCVMHIVAQVAKRWARTPYTDRLLYITIIRHP